MWTYVWGSFVWFPIVLLLAFPKKKKFAARGTNLRSSLPPWPRQVVNPGRHGAGIVVPYNADTTVGYRPLAMGEARLRSLLDKIVAAKDAVRVRAYA
jgi:hypothetical protein